MASRKRKTWNERIAAMRHALSLTQAGAAKRFRVSLRTWASWESGDRVPSGPMQILIELHEKESSANQP